MFTRHLKIHSLLACWLFCNDLVVEMRVNCSLGNLDPYLFTLLPIKNVSVKHWNLASGLNSDGFLLIFSHILDFGFQQLYTGIL